MSLAWQVRSIIIDFDHELTKNKWAIANQDYFNLGRGQAFLI